MDMKKISAACATAAALAALCVPGSAFAADGTLTLNAGDPHFAGNQTGQTNHHSGYKPYQRNHHQEFYHRERPAAASL